MGLSYKIVSRRCRGCYLWSQEVLRSGGTVWSRTLSFVVSVWSDV